VFGDAGRLAELRRRAFLSHDVGVLRFRASARWLLDLVLDTTNLKRGQREAAPLLLLLADDESDAETLRQNDVGEQYSVV
jgi:hypothetical protein